MSDAGICNSGSIGAVANECTSVLAISPPSFAVSYSPKRTELRASRYKAVAGGRQNGKYMENGVAIPTVAGISIRSG